MKLYLCGPMRGVEDLNFPAFRSAAKFLRSSGHEVFDPSDHDEHGHDESWYMARDLAEVCRADGIALLPGHEFSRLGRLELFVAQYLNKELLLLHYDLARDLWTASYEDDYKDAEPRPPSAAGRRPSAPSPSPSPLSPQEEAEALQHAGVVIPTAPAPTPAAPIAGEVRETNAKTGGEKGRKPARFAQLPWAELWALAELMGRRGPGGEEPRLDLVPWDVVFDLARLYGRGAKKYAARNWERGYAWSLSFEACMRHLLQFWLGEDVDRETGQPHLICALFHVAALRRFSQRHPDLDDRGHIGDAQLAEALARLVEWGRS